MEIKCVVVGQLEENCYILTSNNEAFVIDPGDEPQKILSELEKSGAVLKKILLTHGHFDHFGAAAELSRKTGAGIFIHEKDAIMLTDDIKNLSLPSWTPPEHCKCDGYLNDKEELTLGSEKITVHYTPGHSMGGVSFFCNNSLFCGDLLFKNSIGRFDRGSLRTELLSIKFVIQNFDDSVLVYPGHGESTTIDEEKKNNPYIVNHIVLD